MTYGCQIWGQHNSITKKLQILHNNALRVKNFLPRRTSATPLDKKLEILNPSDIIALKIFMYAYDSVKG